MKRAAWLAVAAAALACSRTTELLPTPAAAAACVAPYPPVRLGTDAQNCTGALAARFGHYALCSCSDLMVTGNLGVGDRDGPAKTQGGPGPGPAAPAPAAMTASVGTDGNLRVESYTEVAGNLVTAGLEPAVFVHGGHVQGNLRGAGGFATMTTMGLWVSGEMASAGDVSGMFKVGGPLHVPAGAVVASEVQPMSVMREPVTVPAPCGCGAARAGLDLAVAVSERRTRNANGTLASEELLTNLGETGNLDLECGEFYVSELSTAAGAGVTLRIRGRVAIFVANDVTIGDNFNVALDANGELDLVVAGSFFMTSPTRLFGSPSAAARTRLWVGGATVSLAPQSQFGATVFAPGAVLLAGKSVKFFGSLYVGTLNVDGDVNISYDPTVQQPTTACPPPS